LHAFFSATLLYGLCRSSYSVPLLITAVSIDIVIDKLTAACNPYLPQYYKSIDLVHTVSVFQ